MSDDTVNYLEQLVGEDKKFKDVSALAEGKAMADEHINRLENELKGLREDLQARLTLEQLMDKMSNTNNDSKDDDHTNQNGTNQNQNNTPDLDRLIEDKLNSKIKARLRQENASLVDQELKKTFGDKYSEVIDRESTKLGLGKEFLKTFKEEQPKAYLKLFTPTRQEQDFTLPPKSGINTSFTPVVSNRTKEYYSELRKKNPAVYWDPKTQLQLHEDAKAWGGY